MTCSPSKAGALAGRGGSAGRLRLATAAVAALGALAASPITSPASASDGVVATVVEQSAAEIRGYWTPERIRAARPVERLGERVGKLTRTTAAAQTTRAAAEVSNSSAYPGRTHGKVFFSVPGRGNFVCSGTAIRAPGRNLVLTAGHCVYDDAARRFATNWMFVPGFRDGRRPFGEWTAHTLATTSQFRSAVRDSERFDVGIAVVRRDANGRGIQDRVGARPVAFNQPRNQFYRAFGYPARPPFNGQRSFRCDSPYRGNDHRFPPPRPMRIECDMTGGSSGGGWVARGRVLSVTSYAYECAGWLIFGCNNPEEGRLFGPYFGNAARDLYLAHHGRARRCGGRVATHRGGPADNAFTGTSGPDVMHGGGGNDLLRGMGGDDVICGGPGNDALYGGPGNNRIYTGSGNDRVFARAPGSNRIWALRGRNRIRCGPGRDRVLTNRLSRVHRSCNVVVRH